MTLPGKEPVTVGIAAIGVYLPENIVTAAQIAEKTGIPRRILEERFGIREKRAASPGEHASDLAVKAARKILTEEDPAGIDAVIYCGSPHKDYPVWPCSAKVQHELGLTRAFAYELLNMSAGFSTALKTARDMLVADPCLNSILLVAGTRESELIDLANSRTRFMLNFSDGGAAMLLRKGHRENVVLGSCLHTDGSFHAYVKVPAGGSVMLPGTCNTHSEQFRVDVSRFEEMKDRLNRISVANFARVVREALARSGFEGMKPDYLALLHLKPAVHKQILNELGLTEEQSVYLANYGHMSSLDMVVSIHQGLREGRIKDGHLVVAASAGTGYTWGANVIKWGKDDDFRHWNEYTGKDEL